MKRAFLPSLCLLFAFAGCESSDPFEQSCAGKDLPVLDCRPFEYAIVRSASLTPERVQVGDPTSSVRIQASLVRCPRLPRTVDVRVQALWASGSPLRDAGGGGSSERVVTLTTLHDDGALGDPEANDGAIDVTVANPFSSEVVPPDATITLQFIPVTASCEGRKFEMTYRTGDRWMSPMRP